MALVNSQKQQLTPEALETLIEESANLVEDSDLHLAALALKLCWTLVSAQPAATPMVSSKVPALLSFPGSWVQNTPTCSFRCPTGNIMFRFFPRPWTWSSPPCCKELGWMPFSSSSLPW